MDIGVPKEQTVAETRVAVTPMGVHALSQEGHRLFVEQGAGAAAGFDYSPALRASRIVWDDRTLDAWLADPERTIPGQAMGYRVDDARDRADLIAYLRHLR